MISFMNWLFILWLLFFLLSPLPKFDLHSIVFPSYMYKISFTESLDAIEESILSRRKGRRKEAEKDVYVKKSEASWRSVLDELPEERLENGRKMSSEKVSGVAVVS